jgi:hypothetical protein
MKYKEGKKYTINIYKRGRLGTTYSIVENKTNKGIGYFTGHKYESPKKEALKRFQEIDK